MSAKRILFAALGSLCLALGTVGIFVPVLPTVPFYLATVFFYANSSEKLHSWFLGTKLYKNNLESYVQKKGMTRRTKAGILVSVTLLMGFGAFMMGRKGIWVPCVILAVVWAAHVVYFVFGVRTLSGADAGCRGADEGNGDP